MVAVGDVGRWRGRGVPWRPAKALGGFLVLIPHATEYMGTAVRVREVCSVGHTPNAGVTRRRHRPWVASVQPSG